MMWPFTRKPREVSNEELRRVLGPSLKHPKGEHPVIIQPGHFLAKNGEVRRAVTLKEKLIANRISYGRGAGPGYWDSVVEVVERHYKRKAD